MKRCLPLNKESVYAGYCTYQLSVCLSHKTVFYLLQQKKLTPAVLSCGAALPKSHVINHFSHVDFLQSLHFMYIPSSSLHLINQEINVPDAAEEIFKGLLLIVF